MMGMCSVTNWEDFEVNSVPMYQLPLRQLVEISLKHRILKRIAKEGMT